MVTDCAALPLQMYVIPYNEGAPMFGEVVAFLQQEGWALWDYEEGFLRLPVGSVFADVIFVRQDSPLLVLGATQLRAGERARSSG